MEAAGDSSYHPAMPDCIQMHMIPRLHDFQPRTQPAGWVHQGGRRKLPHDGGMTALRPPILAWRQHCMVLASPVMQVFLLTLG